MIRFKTPHGEHDKTVARAVKSRSRRWYKLAEYNGTNSAQAIRWMVRNGKGIRAFEQYPPGTFDAKIEGTPSGVEVWFRRA